MTEVLAAPPGSVPRTVADAVVARLGQRVTECRAACEQLAVVPTGVGFELAERLLGGRFDALDEAEERGMIEVRDGGLAYFRHELARRAVKANLPAIRRRLLNRAVIAALLSQQSRDLDRLVHHAIEADDGETLAAFAPAAGREAGRPGSHRQALAYLEDRAAPFRAAGGSQTMRACSTTMDGELCERAPIRRGRGLHPRRRCGATSAWTTSPGPDLARRWSGCRDTFYMTGATDEAERTVERAVEVLEEESRRSTRGVAPTRSPTAVRILALTEQAGTSGRGAFGRTRARHRARGGWICSPCA